MPENDRGTYTELNGRVQRIVPGVGLEDVLGGTRMVLKPGDVLYTRKGSTLYANPDGENGTRLIVIKTGRERPYSRERV